MSSEVAELKFEFSLDKHWGHIPPGVSIWLDPRHTADVREDDVRVHMQQDGTKLSWSGTDRSAHADRVSGMFFQVQFVGAPGASWTLKVKQTRPVAKDIHEESGVVYRIGESYWVRIP